MINTLSKLTGKTINQPSEVIIQGFSGYASGGMTGTLLKVDDVYSISEGTVIEVSLAQDNLYVVTVMYQPDKLFRYCRLASVDVELNEHITMTDKIGVASDAKLRFEYCTLESSDYPYRILDKTYYKHDPALILCGGMILYMSDAALGKFHQKQTQTSTTTTKQKYCSTLASILRSN